ncbi:hypothetical protein HAZ28_004766 [Salmonella enterica]|nr:hypothetical protein [Salmonella enterica subsp. enterica serovar Sandiego]EEP1514213.1 hypothetical protein [Salmonella enterica]
MLAQSVQPKADIEGKLRSFTSGMTPGLTEEWYPQYGATERLSALREKLINTMKMFLARMEYGAALLNEIEGSDDIVSDNVLALFELEQENLRHFYTVLTTQKDSFVALCEDCHDDRLMPAYTDTINMAKSLFDMLEKMRWLIEEHNIDCGPRGEGNLLSSPDEIDAWFASL